VRLSEFFLIAIVGAAVGWFVVDSSPSSRMPDLGPLRVRNGSAQPSTVDSTPEQPEEEVLGITVKPSPQPDQSDQTQKPKEETPPPQIGPAEGGSDTEPQTSEGVSESPTTSSETAGEETAGSGGGGGSGDSTGSGGGDASSGGGTSSGSGGTSGGGGGTVSGGGSGGGTGGGGSAGGGGGGGR
jgi:hypothetical protein